MSLSARRKHFLFALWALPLARPPSGASIAALAQIHRNSAEAWRHDWLAALLDARSPPARTASLKSRRAHFAFAIRATCVNGVLGVDDIIRLTGLLPAYRSDAPAKQWASDWAWARARMGLPCASVATVATTCRPPRRSADWKRPASTHIRAASMHGLPRPATAPHVHLAAAL